MVQCLLKRKEMKKTNKKKIQKQNHLSTGQDIRTRRAKVAYHNFT